VKHKFTRTPENARVCGNIWRCYFAGILGVHSLDAILSQVTDLLRVFGIHFLFSVGITKITLDSQSELVPFYLK
jgi:hypothetical protein